jgi:hypothetical protein
MTWWGSFPKVSSQVIGYTPSTVKSRSARMDMFY